MENYDYNTESFKQQLKEKLQSNEVGVTFTKRDGSERRMQCTLSATRIPTEQLPQGTGDTSTPETVSKEAIRVFDLEKQAWRSFRYDSIKTVKF